MGEVTAGDVTAIDVIKENCNSNDMLMKGCRYYGVVYCIPCNNCPQAYI